MAMAALGIMGAVVLVLFVPLLSYCLMQEERKRLLLWGVSGSLVLTGTAFVVLIVLLPEDGDIGAALLLLAGIVGGWLVVTAPRPSPRSGPWPMTLTGRSAGVASAVGFALLYLAGCWLIVPAIPALLYGIGLGYMLHDYTGDLAVQEWSCILPALGLGYLAARLTHTGALMGLVVALISLAACGLLGGDCPIPFAYPDTPEYALHSLKLLVGIPLAFTAGGYMAGLRRRSDAE